MPPLVMIVAAHPDDETIGAATVLLSRARSVVVHVTDGAPDDARLRSAAGSRADYARLRAEERLAALSIAGVPGEDVLSLGIEDQRAVTEIAPVARELAALVRTLRPRLVIAHAFEGGHPDHDAAAVATRAACALAAHDRGPRPAIAEMTSYHLGAGGALVTGEFLPGPTRVHSRTLTPAQQAAKRRMLHAYASQRATLAPFGADVERFRPASPASLERPHPGPLFYEALRWARFEEVRDEARRALAALGLGGRA